MAGVVKTKRRNQQSNQRKSRANQAKQRKTQAKQKKKARSKQATKCVKKPQLTNKAKRVLGSYMEGICKVVSSEAERLRKENCEPQISGQVLQTALEQSMSKGDIGNSVTPAVKRTKRKKEASVEDAEKVPSPSEKQAAPSKKLPKQRKRSTTSVSN